MKICSLMLNNTVYQSNYPGISESLMTGFKGYRWAGSQGSSQGSSWSPVSQGIIWFRRNDLLGRVYNVLFVIIVIVSINR